MIEGQVYFEDVVSASDFNRLQCEDCGTGKGGGAVVAGTPWNSLGIAEEGQESLRIIGCQAEIRAHIFFPNASNSRCCLRQPARWLLTIFLKWVRKAQCISCILTSRGVCTRHATPPASSWPPYIGDVNPANDATATANYPASCCELAFLGGWWSQMLWMRVSFPLL